MHAHGRAPSAGSADGGGARDYRLSILPSGADRPRFPPRAGPCSGAGCEATAALFAPGIAGRRRNACFRRAGARLSPRTVVGERSSLGLVAGLGTRPRAPPPLAFTAILRPWNREPKTSGWPT